MLPRKRVGQPQDLDTTLLMLCANAEPLHQRRGHPPTTASPASMTVVPLRARSRPRVLGVLVEKQHTVPDSYPLSLNALTLGCNQKTARDPVINATEAEVLDADDLKRAQPRRSRQRFARGALRAQRRPRARACPAGRWRCSWC